MPIILTCACGQRLRVPDGSTGAARCPKCRTPVPIPSSPPPASGSRTVPPSPPRPTSPPPPPAGPRTTFSLDDAIRSASKSAPPAPPPTRRPAPRPAPEERLDIPDAPPARSRPTPRPAPPPAFDDDPRPIPEFDAPPRPWPLILGGLAVFLVFAVGGGLAAYFLVFKGDATDTAATTPATSSDGGGRPGGRPPKQFEGHADMVNALAFSKDGALLASASRDKTVRVWQVATATESKSVTHPAGPVWNVVWTAEGRLVTTSGDGKKGGTLSWIDPVTGVFRRTIEVADKNAGPTRALAVSPDGRRLAWLNGAKMEVISAALEDSPTPAGSYPFSVYDTLHAAFTPDAGKVLLTSNSGTQVWSWAQPSTGKTAIRKAQYSTQDTTGVAVAGNGLYAVSTNRGVVTMLDPATLDLVENVRDLPTTGVFGVAASPDGRYVASAIENGVRVFDPKNRQEVGRFAAPPGVKFQATSVAYSPDGGKIAAGGGFTVFDNPRNFTIFLWDAAAMTPPPAKKN